MSETPITHQNAGESFVRSTDARHRFVVSRRLGYIIEVEDAHFHHDSAVMLPDYDEREPGTRDGTEDRYSGLAVLAACYGHAQRFPNHQILITGHTDSTGAASYNEQLSRLRAESVHAALLGKRDRWAELAAEKHQVEDYQRILVWISDTFGWECDPGEVDNQAGSATEGAVEAFQAHYNSAFDQEIAEDGKVGPQTWRAFFDLYMLGLREMLKLDDAELGRLRQGLKFVSGDRPFVGCGEHHPIEEPRQDDYFSAKNRRVEVLFFDPREVPKLTCHGSKSCSPGACEIYNLRKFRFRHLACTDLDLPCPVPVDVYFDDFGTAQSVVDRYQLVSEDGEYDETLPTSQSRPFMEGLLALRFESVLPARKYSLYHWLGDSHRVPIFEGVSREQLNGPGKPASRDPVPIDFDEIDPVEDADFPLPPRAMKS